jgi:hypothetical protein
MKKMTLKFALDIDIEIDGIEPSQEILNKKLIEAISDKIPSVAFEDEELDCIVFINSSAMEPVLPQTPQPTHQSTVPSDSHWDKNLKHLINLLKQNKSTYESSTVIPMLLALDKIQQECKVPDWDGYGAEPLSPLAVNDLVLFISQYPNNLPVLEICPEPDGCISLDWALHWSLYDKSFFSLSFMGNGRVVCFKKDRLDETTSNLTYNLPKDQTLLYYSMREFLKDQIFRVYPS